MSHGLGVRMVTPVPVSCSHVLLIVRPGAALMVPLTRGGGFSGVFSLFRRDDRPFTDLRRVDGCPQGFDAERCRHFARAARQALELFADAGGRRLAPTVITYSTVLRACRLGRLWREAPGNLTSIMWGICCNVSYCNI